MTVCVVSFVLCKCGLIRWFAEAIRSYQKRSEVIRNGPKWSSEWSEVIRCDQKWSEEIRSDQMWSEVIIRMVRMMIDKYLGATICDHAVRLLWILLCKTHLLQQLGLLLPRCNIFLLIYMVYIFSSIPYRLAFPALKILYIYVYINLHIHIFAFIPDILAWKMGCAGCFPSRWKANVTL